MASTSSQEEKPSGQWWQNPCDRLFNCGKASDSNSQSVNEGEAKEKPRKPVAFWDLFKYGTKGDKICAIIGMAAGFVAGMGLAIPYFTSGMIASALIVHGKNAYDPKLYSHAMPWVAADLALAIITFACAYIQTYCLKRSCANITAKLRIKFIESILQQDASYLDTQKFGSINQQLSENIDKITDGIGEQIGLIIRGVAAVVACIVFGLAVGWQGTLINLIVCPVNLIFMVLMIKLISISTRKQEPYAEKAASVMQESIINVKTVQCCNGQTQMVDRFRSLLATGRGYAVLNYFWNGFFEACVFMALYVFFVVTFYYNAVAYYFGDIKDPGTVYIVPNAMFGAAYYLAINSPSVVSITKARVAAALIYEKIEREAPASKSVDLEDVEVTDGRIVFSNVIFSYSNGRRVLDGLSFTAEPGETVALVGHSGCGKSTTVSLLLRLYEPENGSITIDGMDIRLVNPASIRRAVGLVRQEPVLFGGTIADNIRLGDDEITDEQIEEACKITNAHDFIMRLSDGYDTPVGPGCVQLSGGQKQRIAIARAIVDNPKILLLDEATSALDVHSEMHVQKALKAASKGRTTLVIAHRLSTLRDASKIVVFDAGKVVESGTHYELQEFGGVYSSLVKAQEFKDSTISDDSITGVPEDSEYVPFSMPSEEVIVSPSRESFQVRPSSRTNSISCSTMELRPIPPTPATAAPQKCQRVNGLWLLSKNLKGQRAKLAIGIFVAMLRGLELPLYAFFIYFVMDALGDKGNWIDYRNTMLAYSFINLGIGVFSFFTILIPVALNGYIAENVVDAIKLRFLASILKRDGAFFDKPETSNAKLVSMMNSDVPQIKSGLDHRLVMFVNNVVALVVLLIEAGVFCWQMTVAGFSMCVFLVVIMFICMRYSHLRTNRVQAMTTHANLAVEIIENVRTIQLLNREEYFSTRYEASIHEVRTQYICAAVFESIVFSIGMSSCFLADAVSYSVGVPLLYAGKLKPGNVFVAAMAINVVSWALQFVGITGLELMRAEPACSAIIPLLDESIDNDGNSTTESEDDGVSPPINGSVVAERIEFAYPARPNIKVANGLTFEAPEGQMIALVGPSGGGKSTIIALLERFYPVQSGKLTVDGTPVSKFNLHHLRNHMALVGQEPVLFAGTIKDNILLGIEDGGFDDVQNACRLANATGFIEKLPLGYETEVGEKGAMLSGGQKQRIAIARAIARNPQILLLDEATSALDSESEKAVQEALNSASKSRTVISIAHRLSSIQDADHIYFIEGGRVVESGTHTELVGANGKYAGLVRKQRLNK